MVYYYSVEHIYRIYVHQIYYLASLNNLYHFYRKNIWSIN
ncbi:hypothetical protein VK055_4670 [Klebsiella pneumoniae subsp. pneumoniae]|nr:hypothetical protein VK055_4670 [Klebsiella pneumoniae subsp. pneumoniae]